MPSNPESSPSLSNEPGYRDTKQYVEYSWPKSRYFTFEFITGLILTVNFSIFWALPIFGMGQLWKLGLNKIFSPIFAKLDENKSFRKFCSDWIFGKEQFSDFGATLILLIIGSISSFLWILSCQLTQGYLTWTQIFLYYCSWVGLGGRSMGAAYSLAHREGHTRNLYNKTIRTTIGNICENWLGFLFGNVPYNFSGSHIAIHHRTNGHKGDTFYMWDWDRTSFRGFMLFVCRIFIHMLGFSSLRFFKANGQERLYNQLAKGMLNYFITVPTILLVITRSPSFLFWIYLQPLTCMTYFLALINVGFHGFIEYVNDKPIPCINASCIVGGDDDYFGEDNHMAHHYSTSTYFKALDEWVLNQLKEWQGHVPSVFYELSIVELSILILAKQWDILVDKLVLISPEEWTEHLKTNPPTMQSFVELAKEKSKLRDAETKKKLGELLKMRAQRVEISFEDYQNWVVNPKIRGGVTSEETVAE